MMMCIASIFYFDMKQRAVYWWLFLFLFIFSCVLRYQTSLLSTLLFDFGINSILLLFKLFVLQVYFSIRYKSNTFIINKAIGLGDILLFLSPAVFFTPFNFVLFLVISFAVSLITHFLLLHISRDYKKTVPLAGFVSVVFGVFIFSPFLTNAINLIR
jgi:hypothetical protein